LYCVTGYFGFGIGLLNARITDRQNDSQIYVTIHSCKKNITRGVDKLLTVVVSLFTTIMLFVFVTKMQA
jgi:hypothetical protein